MSNWFKFFIAFYAIFMLVNYYKDDVVGVLFFGFMLIGTILLWMKK